MITISFLQKMHLFLTFKQINQDPLLKIARFLKTRLQYRPVSASLIMAFDALQKLCSQIFQFLELNLYGLGESTEMEYFRLHYMCIDILMCQEHGKRTKAPIIPCLLNTFCVYYFLTPHGILRLRYLFMRCTIIGGLYAPSVLAHSCFYLL